MENRFKVGDRVVWDFCCDMPQEYGEVVGVNGSMLEVQYMGKVLGGDWKMYREWMDCENVDFESAFV